MEIGQPDMTQAYPDDAFTTVNITGTYDGQSPTKEVPRPVHGFQRRGRQQQPDLSRRFANTRSAFRGYALSDGTSLYVADGGNDRVLIYNPSPPPNAAAASIVLGQTDFVTDAPTDGADTMDAPLSLAWDPINNNLYVADTYNQRVLVYTMSEQDLPYNAVLNAASLIIYAIGTSPSAARSRPATR